MQARGAYHEPSWAEAGQRERGGVRLFGRKTRHLRLQASDFHEEARAQTPTRPEWLLFRHPEGRCLSFEWEWLTEGEQKFWPERWAKAAVAFDRSFATVDAREARFLVLWARASHACATFDLELQLRAAGPSGSLVDSASVSLCDHLGRALGTEWVRAVIPLAAFATGDPLNLGALQCLLLSAAGNYPENEQVFVQLDEVCLSAAELLPRVRNAGYLLEEDELLVLWDEVPGRVDRYVIGDGDSVVTTSDRPEARLPLAPLRAARARRLSIVAENGSERSSPTLLDVVLDRPPTLPARISLGSGPSHEISRYVFGANYAPAQELRAFGVSVQRWGGNDTTKYNWQADVTNAGNDWFFLNTETRSPLVESDKSYYRYVESALRAGADVNCTIPIGDFVAKPHPAGGRYGSFPLAIYPEQHRHDGAGHGDGRRGNGTAIWDNDPSLALMPSSPEFQARWVQTLKDAFGGATSGGVRFYSLDNEPGLWNVTHRDAYPKGLSAEELAARSEAYAAAIKSVDPAATVIGFCAWGVMELAGSNLDYTPAGPDGYRRYGQFEDENERWSERRAHAEKSQLVYLLERFREMDQAHGKRLVDVIDVHVYPEIYARDPHGNLQRLCENLPFDPELSRLQFEALREWYDPRFELGPKLESWTAAEGNRQRLWDEFHPLIPALRRIVETTYPGTKLAINEYVTGSEDHFHGALLRVALLGIFLQEGLFMAQSWTRLRSDRFLYLAHRLYRNYDGQGAGVEGQFLRSRTSSPDLLSYVVRGLGKLFLVLVNKNPSTGFSVRVPVAAGTRSLATYQLVESLNLRLYERTRPVTPPDVTIALAPFSALLAVLT